MLDIVEEGIELVVRIIHFIPIALAIGVNRPCHCASDESTLHKHIAGLEELIATKCAKKLSHD